MIKNYYLKKVSIRYKMPSQAYKGFFSLLMMFCCFCHMNAQHIGADWTTQSTGTLNGVGFTLTGTSNGLFTYDLSTAAYSAAPLGSSQQITQVFSNTAWEITFDSPVTDLGVYFIFYQIGTLTFNETPTFLSGVNLSVSGNDVIMSAPAGSDHHGLIRFEGTHTTITITTNGCAQGGAGINFGLLDPTLLPVELASFRGAANHEMVQLDWETASELNNAGFEVERSANNKDFQRIGYAEGNGTTAENSSYQFMDKAPVDGMNYYRLKQMDLDGQFEYSNIVAVNYRTKNTAEIQLYPNPVQDQLTISNAVGTLTIYNQLGQKIKKMDNTSEAVNIDTSKFPKGHYVLFFRKTNGETIARRFVK